MTKSALFVFLLMGVSCFGQKEQVSILIDPGHGGEDPGHLPYTDSLKQEKHLTLEISKKLGAYLEHNLENVEVTYTRTDDSYPTREERVDQANNNGVDLFLSIHCNGSPKVDVCGTESHVHNKDAKEAYKLARQIETQFKSRAGRKSRGVKTIDDLGHSLQLLKYSKMPAVLVECGFITHVNEAKYLNSEYGQEIIASAIFRGVRDYLEKKYPEIDFVPVPPEIPDDFVAESGGIQNVSDELPIPDEVVETKTPYYMVQIMASIDSVNVNSAEFANLSESVERRYIESTSMYRYKYYVGPFESKKEAKQGQKAIQSQGFTDAFLVFFPD